MAHVIFFEKPGCQGNARQRALLERAGHTLTRRNLLEAPWTRDERLGYLRFLPVQLWFNRAAPKIKSGELVFEDLDAERALEVLIRQPLMEREEGVRMVCFDLEEVERFIGLGPIPMPSAPMESSVTRATRGSDSRYVNRLARPATRTTRSRSRMSG